MSVAPGPTVGITIGAANFPTLTAQPFGYEETDTRAGLTARKWAVTGLLKPSEWLTLLTAYDGWRDLRILDAPTSTSGVVGTTINLSGKGAGSTTWTNIPCWFIGAPQAEQNGRYLSVSVELVDAAQALAVILRQKETESEQDDLPNLGTVALGSAIVTLTKPMLSRRDGPDVALTTTGVSYITGPFRAHTIRDIEGRITTGTFDDVLAWYDTTISSRPATGAYFPVTAPTASAEDIIVDGVKVTRFTVQVTAIQII